jgi:hypothetical protein
MLPGIWLINIKQMYLFLILQGASVIQRVGEIPLTCPNAWHRSTVWGWMQQQ